MEMIIVIVIVAGALLYFIRSFGRKARGNGSCGCGCSCGSSGNECEIRDKERT
jgi:attachment p12 family protein